MTKHTQQTTTETPLRKHWRTIKADNKAIADAGQVVASLLRGRLQLVAPFSEGFPGEARELGGRWRSRSQFWSFPASNATQRKAIASLIEKHHGAAQVPDILKEGTS